jgi:hypothetical protein
VRLDCTIVLGPLPAGASPSVNETQLRRPTWGRRFWGLRLWSHRQPDALRNALADTGQRRIDGVSVDRIDNRASRMPNDSGDVKCRFIACAGQVDECPAPRVHVAIANLCQLQKGHPHPLPDVRLIEWSTGRTRKDEPPARSSAMFQDGRGPRRARINHIKVSAVPSC